MSDHDLLPKPADREAEIEPVHGVADHAEHKARPFAANALPQIDRILHTGQDFDLLPDLFAVLADGQRAEFLKNRIGDLKKLPGKLALQCAQLLGAKPAQVIKTALASTEPPPAAELHAYLVTISGEDLASITGDTFTKLRKAMPGPLLTHVPTLAQHLPFLEKHAGFLRWFVETTRSEVAASLLANYGTPDMGKTLDQENLWTEWVNHLRPAGNDTGSGLRMLAQSCSDKDAKAKLTAVAGPSRSSDEQAKYMQQHAGDLRDELAGKHTVQSLLAAAGRALEADPKDHDKLIAELQKLGASADDYLSLALSLDLDKPALLRVLVGAPDVTADHLVTFLMRSGHAIDALADDKTRALVTKKAPSLRLQDLLITNDRDQFHATFVDPKHDGLRNWFLAEASPSDLLWFCSHDAKSAARAVRFVDDKRGMDWVRDLTPPAPGGKTEKQLRILAINLHGGPTEKFIREVLLPDGPVNVHAPRGPEGEVEKVDDRVFGGEDQRLDEALYGDPAALLARIADLDEKRRVQLGNDKAVMRAIGRSLQPDQWARAAHLLDVSFAMTVAASPGPSSMIVSYLASRPQTEELAALDDPDLVKTAAAKVHTNLLVVFPALREPKHLAKALARDEEILRLLLEGSDPNLVANLLSNDAVIDVALPIIDKHSKWLERLPKFKHMTARGKQGVQKLAKQADDEFTQATLEDVQSGEADVDPKARRQGAALHAADEKNTLVEKIEALSGAHAKKSVTTGQDGKEKPVADKPELDREANVNVLALLDMHRAEVPELLNDRLQRATVDKVHELTDLPPDVAIPWIAPSELARMPNSLRWWLTYRDALPALHQLEKNNVARAMVIGALNSNTLGAFDWLKRVPAAPALDQNEERALDAMKADITDGAAMRMLFHTRFGFPPPDAYDAKTVAELYKIISRLPPGHIEQQRIKSVAKTDLDPIGAAGMWDGSNVNIDDEVTPGSEKDTFYEKEHQDLLPKEEFKARYGFDEDKFQELKKAQRLELGYVIEAGKGAQEAYRMKEQKFDLFTQVVLHEVGHAVDEILGENTEPVYGFAKWREYDIEGGFDAWANKLGGWDRVERDDKKEIRELITDAVRAGVKVNELAPKGHPIFEARYAKVGIIEQVLSGKKFHYTERVAHGDSVFVANGYTGKLYTLDANAAAVAPSSYALHAPAEYFAEAYVEYYRGVDGSPGSSAKKGGALAAPVKTWFDNNVDRVKFDPKRFESS